MKILVISLGIITLLACIPWWIYQLFEYARKRTETAIAVFYRDHPLECTMFLNKISLVETKKEIAKQKASLENNITTTNTNEPTSN